MENRRQNAEKIRKWEPKLQKIQAFVPQIYLKSLTLGKQGKNEKKNTTMRSKFEAQIPEFSAILVPIFGFFRPFAVCFQNI